MTKSLLVRVKELANKNDWKVNEFIIPRDGEEYKRLVMSRKLSNGEERKLKIDFVTENHVEKLWFSVRDLEIEISEHTIVCYIDQVNSSYNVLGAYTQDKIDVEDLINNLIVDPNPSITIWLYNFIVEVI